MSEKTDVTKMSLVQLKEILNRENILLKNDKLIENLPDKGESIKDFRNKVEKEIKYREELEEIETSIKKLSLNDDGKHIQKLCEIEKTPKKERYKPFATLNKVQEVPPDSKAFKIMEDCAHCNKPTKLIPLPESMQILKKQDERVKEEQVRARTRRVLERLEEYEAAGGNENESEVSDLEEYSEVEEAG